MERERVSHRGRSRVGRAGRGEREWEGTEGGKGTGESEGASQRE